VQRIIEQSAGGAQKRPALSVFLVARYLAEPHHGRTLRPFAENGLRRVFI